MTLYTVGHSTRSLDEFLALLAAHGVGLIVDVRRYPGSRRFPHFGRDTLSQSLAAAGIGYVHEPDLGGRRAPRADSPHTAWRSASFRAFADHMDSAEFAAALDRVLARAATSASCLMCAEAVPWRCHRQLIADALVARAHQVRHILSPSRADVHTIHPHARLLDGRLIYDLATVRRGSPDPAQTPTAGSPG
jgi:uncharacterized protein (DUF488 family)